MNLKASSRIVVGLLVLGSWAGGVVLRQVVAAPAVDAVESLSVQSCASLPELWSGSSAVQYETKSDTVRFMWHAESGDATASAGTESPATVKQGQTEARIEASDARCPEQPGLETFVEDLRRSDEATRRESCLDLRALLDVLREEYPGEVGSVAVPVGADEEVIRRRHPEVLEGNAGDAFRDLIRARAGGSPRSVNLAEAQSTLLTGCVGVG